MTHVPRIVGGTRLFTIIGDPIAQVRSPEVFNERFAAMGADAVLVPMHIPADRFESTIPALLGVRNLDGVLVTVPFKQRMTAFAERLGATARTVGAVNALRREADGSWSGDMFDGVGFTRGAERKGQRVRGRRVALFGAGGAGSAIACALADAGVRSIDVIDIDAAKAKALVDKLERPFPGCTLSAVEGIRAGVDMIVNASSVGMQPEDGLPGEIGPLDPSMLVGDVVITAMPTALIRHATRYECEWVDGRDMHGGQIDALISFFAPASRTRTDAPAVAL